MYHVSIDRSRYDVGINRYVRYTIDSSQLRTVAPLLEHAMGASSSLGASSATFAFSSAGPLGVPTRRRRHTASARLRSAPANARAAAPFGSRLQAKLADDGRREVCALASRRGGESRNFKF